MSTYQTKVYRKQGGDEMVVASGGKITIESGGELEVAGVTIDESTLAVNGLTASADALNTLDGALADATIVVSTETDDVRTITIQLKDADGNDLAYQGAVQLAVFADANGDAFSTGGSTGLAAGTDGALLALVAKKLFLAISEADGDIDLTYTDSGTAAAYLAVILPNGRTIISDPLTNV